jgi:hypothetical protein
VLHAQPISLFLIRNNNNNNNKPKQFWWYSDNCGWISGLDVGLKVASHRTSKHVGFVRMWLIWSDLGFVGFQNKICSNGIIMVKTRLMKQKGNFI